LFLFEIFHLLVPLPVYELQSRLQLGEFLVEILYEEGLSSVLALEDVVTFITGPDNLSNLLLIALDSLLQVFAHLEDGGISFSSDPLSDEYILSNEMQFSLHIFELHPFQLPLLLYHIDLVLQLLNPLPLHLDPPHQPASLLLLLLQLLSMHFPYLRQLPFYLELLILL
jgi:hypothetical protein